MTLNSAIMMLVLVEGCLLGWQVSRRTTFFSPASVYIWFMTIDFAMFGYIFFTNPNRSNLTFTAMPWPPFDVVFIPTAGIYSILIGIGWLSIYKLVPLRDVRRPKKPTATLTLTMKKSLQRHHRKLNSLLALFIILVFMMELYHFIEIDKSILWQNSRYLTITRPETAGIYTLPGRIIHFTLRPLALFLVAAGVALWKLNKKKTAFPFLVLSVYPFLITFAENSRWAVVLWSVGLVVIYFFGGFKRNLIALTLGGILDYLIFLKVLVGRNTPYQGLAGSDDVIALVFSRAEYSKWAIGFFLNVFQGAQGLANALLIHPSFPDIYKLGSFSPSISAIDHFNVLQERYMVRITPVVPMNAYAESYLFGPLFFLFFLTVLMLFLRSTTKLYLRNDLLGISFAVFAYWVIFFLSQYPVRNSMRLIYIALLIGWLMTRREQSQMRRKTHAPVLYEDGKA